MTEWPVVKLSRPTIEADPENYVAHHRMVEPAAESETYIPESSLLGEAAGMALRDALKQHGAGPRGCHLALEAALRSVKGER